MKIYTNELGHITNMAAMPIYGKNLKKYPVLNQTLLFMFFLLLIRGSLHESDW